MLLFSVYDKKSSINKICRIAFKKFNIGMISTGAQQQKKLFLLVTNVN